MKAGNVPQSKLHQKLVRATQVIISLVREKEQLTQKVKTLKSEVPPSTQEPHIPLATHVALNASSDFASPQSPKPNKLSKETSLLQSQKQPSKVSTQQAVQQDSLRHLPAGKHVVFLFFFNVVNCYLFSGVSSPSLHDVDTSLVSLQFTESSMDGLSLEQVVQQIDRNLTDISSVEGKSSKARVRHSTPQLSDAHNSDGGVNAGSIGDLQREKNIYATLELVGHEVKPQVKSGIKQIAPAFARTTKSKSKVRNYNKRSN